MTERKSRSPYQRHLKTPYRYSDNLSKVADSYQGGPREHFNRFVLGREETFGGGFRSYRSSDEDRRAA